MSSLGKRRARERSAAAISLAVILLLAPCGPASVAAAQTDSSERRLKLEERRDLNADAHRKADELREQMGEMEAEAIDRGLLLTLDDVVFTTNTADLSSNGHRRLNALAAFLKQHMQRSVAIDGYAGASDYRYDQSLSKRRAEAVKAYLIRMDISPSRLTARRSNEPPQDLQDSATRRPTLRRVEVIIEDPLSPVSQSGGTAQGT